MSINPVSSMSILRSGDRLEQTIQTTIRQTDQAPIQEDPMTTRKGRIMATANTRRSRSLSLLCLRLRLLPSSSIMALLLFLLISPTHAYVYAGNESFASLPALFGRAMPLGDNVVFSARLQFLPESPFLCEPLLNYTETSFVVPPRLQETSHNANHHEHAPRDSYYEPVALLAARGDCPFIRKAVVAETLHPSIQYLLIYNSPQQSSSTETYDPYATIENDDHDDDDMLVPMYSEFGDTRLVLLSLSHRSGHAIKQWMVQQPKAVRLAGGPRIQLDALVAPNSNANADLLSVEDLRNMLITAVALLLALVVVSGCLLVAAGSIGHVHVSGNRIVLTTTATLDPSSLDMDGHGGTAASTRTVVHHHYAIGGGRRLLSERQVRQLAKDQQEATREQVEAIVLASWARQREREDDNGCNYVDSESDDVVDINLNAAANRDHAGLDEQDQQEHTCAICIDELYDFASSPEDAMDYRIASSLLTLPCHHTFHLECLVPWLTERQSKCPLCKYDVFDFIMNQQVQERQQRRRRPDGGRDGQDDTGTSASPRRTRQLSFLWNGLFGNYRRVGQHEDEGRIPGSNANNGIELTEREQAVQELEMATAQLRRTADSGLMA